MVATTSTNCTSFYNLRANPVERRVQSPPTHGSPSRCRKLDGVAMWLVNGVASAFFAFLE
ncbi:hypothetical protein ACSBR1_036808 [Camellia fascicularis]